MSGHELSVLIVDDEAPARERLERLVAELPGWRVAGACGTGLDALELVGKLRPSIVLLDIQMPGMGGIEAARHLSALAAPPAVIFTTAYDQYALEAFDSHAIGYLLKPIRRERLETALQHAARLRAPQLRELSAGERAPRRHIAARLRDELRLIPIKEVLFFRAEQKYVTVKHARGEELIEESLKELEEEFSDLFVRAHRSLLVAIAQVTALDRDGEGRYTLKLRDHREPLAVSRRQLPDLKRRLGIVRGEPLDS
jgi:two-component system, LytTR family, response regulator AlgR